jgi:hypothetical protein
MAEPRREQVQQQPLYGPPAAETPSPPRLDSCRPTCGRLFDQVIRTANG